MPFDNDDSTYKVYKEGLLNRVPDLTEHFFPIDPSLSGNNSKSVFQVLFVG